MTNNTATSARINWLDWVISYGIPSAVLVAFNFQAGAKDIGLELTLGGIALGFLLAVLHWGVGQAFRAMGLGSEVLLQVVLRIALSAGLAVAVGQTLLHL